MEEGLKNFFHCIGDCQIFDSRQAKQTPHVCVSSSM